jgi:MFS family permease
MQVAVRRAIIIGSLGYFIDLFDIQLFAVLRLPSLTEIGVSSDQLATVGGQILNAQMAGMILGAFLWGWLGDRFGRLKAIYGSILIYSIGTLACGFVHDSFTYGLMRFVTGFGLAGETGAAITLVSEMMIPQKRGWGVTIVGAIAFLGPAVAVLISWFVPWRETYIIASLMGFALFILRRNLLEPTLFQKTDLIKNGRGSLKLLMQPQQAKIYLFYTS